ncbi:MAG: arylesterase [Flammeovirgaceae bacterium]|nr:arylesterase [Flammeovirgaceae bacterium]MDW8286950.1 arylesterase [Flammeovirgaceae bacterium]
MTRLLTWITSIAILLSCTKENTTKTNSANEQVMPRTTEEKRKTIVFFGNSLTAGFGLSPEESFPSLIQRKIDSLNLPYRVINAGNSGETSAGGNSRINWILSQQSIDIFVLELGANDGLRGISPEETKKNLRQIFQKVKEKYPAAKLILAGMEVPPNMGEKYASEFRAIFPALAQEFKAALIPFLLEGVAANPTLNLPDGIHPNAQGQKIVCENVWKVLKELL